MFRFLSIILIFTYSYIPLSYASTIAILVPLEHEAMNQIVSGIRESLPSSVKVLTQNAHADPNMQLALIKQMNDQDIDIVMPIGSSSCQMTLAHRPNKITICVAAIMEQATTFATGINDEIPISISLAKLPKLKRIAVIYSASEKIAPEIEHLQEYAKEHNIHLHLAMVQSMIDLPSAAKTSPKDIEAFLILKDHIVVSGASIVAAEAAKRQIPLIASDESSVMNGATIAIGAKEKDIGLEAGKMAGQILEGAPVQEVPYRNIEAMTLFVNTQNLALQKILDMDALSKIGLPILRLKVGK
ncbi:MAG: ABC transporter substrate binding protein [Pseudomonadota bacterium]